MNKIISLTIAGFGFIFIGILGIIYINSDFIWGVSIMFGLLCLFPIASIDWKKSALQSEEKE